MYRIDSYYCLDKDTAQREMTFCISNHHVILLQLYILLYLYLILALYLYPIKPISLFT